MAVVVAFSPIVLLLLVKLSELPLRLKVAAPVTAKVVPTVKLPPMPAFPPVESVVVVRDPVMLLVPIIDNPPLVFEITRSNSLVCRIRTLTSNCLLQSRPRLMSNCLLYSCHQQC